MMSDFQVGPGTVVTLAYRGYDGDGEALSEELLRADFVFGFAGLPPRVERALDGLGPGRTVNVRLDPGEAFGERDTHAIVEIDRSELPEDAEPGDVFEAENAAGQVVTLKILDVNAEAAVLDLNHPLAGQPISFELLVEAVRPASEAEIARAKASLEEAAGQLIPATRLLRGRPKGYEDA